MNKIYSVSFEIYDLHGNLLGHKTENDVAAKDHIAAKNKVIAQYKIKEYWGHVVIRNLKTVLTKYQPKAQDNRPEYLLQFTVQYPAGKTHSITGKEAFKIMSGARKIRARNADGARAQLKSDIARQSSRAKIIELKISKAE